MKKNLTEIVFILDRSGSMTGLESDTIGGFNSLIKEHRKLEGECLISTVLFDHERQVIHDRINLADIPLMTENDYVTRGSTALIDAIGCSIHHISNIHKYIRSEDVPEHTIFVITTDGFENASHIYTQPQVKKMIEEKEKSGWEFIFLGANIDAAETARGFGIREETAVNYHADSVGTAEVYEGVTRACMQMRSTGSLDRKWRKNIDSDYKNRK